MRYSTCVQLYLPFISAFILHTSWMKIEDTVSQFNCNHFQCIISEHCISV